MQGDIIVSQSRTQTNTLLKAREDISDKLREKAAQQNRHLLGLDVQVPTARLGEFLTTAQEVARQYWTADPHPFAHCAQVDQFTTIHFNCIEPTDNEILSSDDLLDNAQLRPFLEHTEPPYTLTRYLVWLAHQYDGSHSAEHGGLGSKHLYHTAMYTDEKRLNQFANQKRQHDPHNLFQQDRWNTFSIHLNNRKSQRNE